jgi:hypothetical protein
MKRSFLAVAFLAVVSLATLTARHAHADADGPLPGEPVLLVVADVAEQRTALAGRDTIGARFGALDGLSVDATDHYELTAALVQTGPSAVGVRCPDHDGPFTARVRGKRVRLECAQGFKRVLVGQRAELTYVERSAFASHTFGRCGSATSSPCQQERYHELFGPDLRLEPGRSIVATGFRTRAGAEEFLTFARAVGVTDLVVVQAIKRGGGDIGLGQEPHPDGSGPLLGTLPNQEAYQR